MNSNNIAGVITALFDYNRMEGNERLTRIISDTESRYDAEIDDDFLVNVSAAGDSSLLKTKPQRNGDGAV